MNRPENTHLMTTSDAWLTLTDARRLAMNIMPPGTIIFPKRGGAIATNKKRLLLIPSTCDLNVMGINAVEPLRAYLWVFWQGIDLGALGDGSNVPQINNHDVIPLPLPIPPAAEQSRIAEEAERLLSIVSNLGNELIKACKVSETLRSSILNAAFSGHLSLTTVATVREKDEQGKALGRLRG